MTNFYGLISIPGLRVDLKFFFAMVVLCLLATSVAVAQTVQRVSASDCVGGTNVFVFTGGSCTYGGFSWSISAGGTILSGHGTRSVQVKWNSTTSNAYVSVSYYCTSNGAGGTSYSSTYTISNPVTPSVSITSNNNNVCQGTNITFTASPLNGGTSPYYNWRINGSIVSSGTLNTFTRDNLNHGDVVSVVMSVSSGACFSTTTATSNSISMNLTTPAVVGVTVLGPPAICSGSTGASFIASVTNGGTSPSYQWYKNGSLVTDNATGAPPYVYAPQTALINGDKIKCKVTSSGCVSNNPAESSAYTVSLTPSVTPTASINFPHYSVCDGQSITFSVSSSFLTPSSTYSWQKNGNSLGTGPTASLTVNVNANSGPAFFRPGDVVTVQVSGLAGTCLASNTATATTNGVPWVFNSLPNATISPTGNLKIQSNATQSISASTGTNYTYQWYANNSAVAAPLGTANPYIAVNSGQYTVEVTGTGGCKKTSTALNLSQNLLPTANAGPDQNLQLPNNAVTLYGSGADPDGSIIAYAWTKVSGPDAILTNANTAILSLSSLTLGTYVLKLTVTDDFSESAWDEVSVVVSGVANTNKGIKVITVNVPGQTTEVQVDALPIGQKTEKWSYLDGLGRSAQQVLTKGSPLQTDIVTFSTFDGLGRSPKAWFPYADGTNGAFKENAPVDQASFYQSQKGDNRAYSESIFENSPLSRVKEVKPPGSAWSSANKKQTISYGKNIASEVRVWNFDVSTKTATGSAYYPAGALYKTIYTDEENFQSIEFKDKSGKVVCKKGGKTGSTLVTTYYVFDDIGNVRFIIPPEAEANLSTVNYSITYNDVFCQRWLFAYGYDDRFRLVEKSVPGGGISYLIYDPLDRVVLTQDPENRLSNQWMFTKYDVLGRTIMSGVYKHSGSATQAEMQQEVDDYYAEDLSRKYFEGRSSTNFASYHGYTNQSFPTMPAPNNADGQPLEVSYYDDYDFDFNATPGETAKGEPSYVNFGGNFLPAPARAKGRATGARTLVIGTTTWLTSAIYYDSDGQVIEAQTENFSSSPRNFEISAFQYDFSGRLIRTERRHKNLVSNNTYSIVLKERPVYDDISHMIVAQYIQVNNEPEERIAAYTYNEIGEITKKLIGNGSGLQSVDYQYDIRGVLSKINGIAGETGPVDYYSQQISYEAPFTGASGRYDGLITSAKWKHDLSNKERLYDFSYDTQNRLQHANYKVNNNGVGWTSDIDLFSEKNFSYDRNGNIKGLQRYAGTLTGSTIDQLVFDYGSGGNQLKKVTDNASAAYKAQGFNDGNISNDDYAYNASGSLTKDLNKNIKKITYNVIGLTDSVIFNNGSYVKYTYDASGGKLAQQYFDSVTGQTKKFEYLGGFIYEDGLLKLVLHSEGRIVPSSNTNLVANRATASAETKEGFTANGSVNMTCEGLNGETYVKVVANQTGTPGLIAIGGVINVKPGERYSFKVLGFQATGSTAKLIVKNGASSANVLWPGATLPSGQSNETWASSSFTVPAGVTSIRLGVYWSSAAVGNTFYVNEVKLYKLDHEYQYFLNDHLGSPRVVLQTSPSTFTFIATMESENFERENEEFLNLRSQNETSLAAANATPGGNQALIMNANYRVGPSRTFKVFPGDVIDASVNAYYVTGSNSSITSMAAHVIAALTEGTGDVVSGIESAYNLSAGANPSYTLGKDQGSTKPSAFLNYILFDDAFRPIEAKSAPLGATSGQLHFVTLPAINVKETGRLFVYLSYDNITGADVYFDDLKITYRESPVIQVNAYYPFGMTAYSWVRDGEEQNRYLYQGKDYDENTKWQDFHARQYDGALGRWFAVDPANQFASPYLAMANSPVISIDPDGRIVWFAVAAAISGAYSGGVLANDGQTNPLKWDYKSGQTWGYMGIGAVVGAVSGGIGGKIALSGIPFANTAAVAGASFINSVGTALYADTDVGISFGVASYNIDQNKWGYLGKKGNSRLENIGYGLGALANLADLNQVINTTQATLYTEANDPISHSAIVEKSTGNPLMSYGPDDGKIGNGGFKDRVVSAKPILQEPGGYKKFALAFRKATSDYHIYKDLPVDISVNKFAISAVRGLGRILPYQGATVNCTNMASFTLWLNGIPNIGIHPYILYGTTWAYSAGIRPDLFSYGLLNYNR
jgi:RHS repeat-associated core domain